MGNWLLYIGIFLCCTGVGLVPGGILIFVWGITQLTNKKETSNTINNYYYELPSEIDSEFIIDKDAIQNFSNKKKKHNHKKDAYSDDTREEMR